jgi:hypothetical protein
VEEGLKGRIQRVGSDVLKLDGGGGVELTGRNRKVPLRVMMKPELHEASYPSPHVYTRPVARYQARAIKKTCAS